MASVSTLLFLKLRLYAKSRLFNVKFHFGHRISLNQDITLNSDSLNRYFTVLRFLIKVFHLIGKTYIFQVWQYQRYLAAIAALTIPAGDEGDCNNPLNFARYYQKLSV